jgi:hypothetical protein
MEVSVKYNNLIFDLSHGKFKHVSFIHKLFASKFKYYYYLNNSDYV